MNKIMTSTRLLVLGLVVLFSMHTEAYAKVYNARYSSHMSRTELQQRLENIPSAVSMRYTPEVYDIVDTYIRRYRKGSEMILGRTNVFFPLFDYELQSNDHLPEEIKHLAIIESSLKVEAVSKTGAVGLWQFMKETAKIQGLTVNNTIDERKDPYLSTKAAYKYLSKLHSDFGDWTLALAAYNCGPGNVRKAIRRSQSKDFWKLEAYLPKETRRYIPKFIAATYLMQYYQAHELEPALVAPKFERTAIARIYNYTTFNEIKELTGITISEIKGLNPAFHGYNIPSSNKGYLLTLPEKSMYQFLMHKGIMENLELTVTNPRESFERTVVVSAFQHRMRELDLFKSMTVLSTRSLIPISQKNVYSLRSMTLPSAFLSEEYEYHVLKNGESLLDLVARMSNTTLEEIIALNEINLNEPPRPGTLIKSKK